MQHKSVLVTGGAGFIGGHIAERLAGDNQVAILDIRPEQPAPGVDGIEGDIRDEDTVEATMQDVDVVFHEAAMVSVAESVAKPKESHAINATGTLNILEAARQHDARVVLASSAAIYGDPEETPVPETHPLDPTSPYGLDKLATDHYARLYDDLYDLETAALRYFNVYGPGQTGGDYAGVIEVFLEQARNGDPITVHGDGTQTRDFVHVDDVVRANLLAAETDSVGRAFNVGTGESVTIKRLAELIRDAVDSDSEIVHAEPREGDIQHSCADITRAQEELGYDPDIGLKEGLQTLIESR
ncbi:MAG: UDP-glucose 4-epimerase [Natronomonas sp.]|jgi:UDP-glucose 4-epimerase|uniref:NAD-dependent epimerase/dehydratase family protein n=1 Tax=Natronomonas sp. TaxID=2184060 RepID=UPI003988B08C